MAVNYFPPYLLTFIIPSVWISSRVEYFFVFIINRKLLADNRSPMPKVYVRLARDARDTSTFKYTIVHDLSCIFPYIYVYITRGIFIPVYPVSAFSSQVQEIFLDDGIKPSR